MTLVTARRLPSGDAATPDTYQFEGLPVPSVVGGSLIDRASSSEIMPVRVSSLSACTTPLFVAT